MALKCVESDRTKRPTIMEVINKLNEIETLKLSLVDQVLSHSEHLHEGSLFHLSYFLLSCFSSIFLIACIQFFSKSSSMSNPVARTL